MDEKQKRITLRLNDDHVALFSLRWLRDTCACEECVHPVTKQRLQQVGDSRDVRFVSLSKRDEDWAFQFDGHVTVHSDAWLRRHCQCASCSQSKASPESVVLRHGAKAWGGDWQPLQLETERWDEAALTALVEGLWRDGICLVSGLARERGTVERFAEKIGYLRETNYGRTFDVEAIADPEHLAYTGVALPLHTDNPYRDPAPGIQLLHCIDAASEGGESLFADGYFAALRLQQEAPASFATLARLRVPFRYRDTACDHQYQRPLIETVAGRICAFYFNDRSMQPLPFPVDDVDGFYEAYEQLERLISANTIRLRLQPGQLVIFDNRRVLHGRGAFSVDGGRRLLQGCYMDWDAVLGRARIWGATFES